MHIPDCRSDEAYNEKYLNDRDARFISGYDFAVEAVANIFNNLNVYPDFEDLLTDNKAIIIDGKADVAKEAIDDWLESERDMLITSMIDNMDDDEYDAIKSRVDGEEG